jgi:Ca2+:H+ antiporter
MAARAGMSLAAIAFPILAVAFVILAVVFKLDLAEPASPISRFFSAAMIAIMLGAVFAAVELADVIAHRVGEPYGTLVLTLAVTVIEVALIASIVLTPNSSPALARDTVFAVIMIVCNGLVGLCIMVGSLRHHEQEFQVSGASLYLHVLGALSVLTLILPNFTTTIVGPYYSKGQLSITIVLYATFLFYSNVTTYGLFSRGGRGGKRRAPHLPLQ